MLHLQWANSTYITSEEEDAEVRSLSRVAVVGERNSSLNLQTFVSLYIKPQFQLYKPEMSPHAVHNIKVPYSGFYAAL